MKIMMLLPCLSLITIALSLSLTPRDGGLGGIDLQQVLDEGNKASNERGDARSGEDQGEIQSPNYPAVYPDNQDETWNLEVAPGQRIILTFESFSLEAHYSCGYDYVQITQGSVEQRYCGSSKPSPIISSGNTMTVTFHSDGSVSRNGFKATWEAVESSAAQCGVKKSDRILGGENTQINEYPWMALLRHKRQASSGFFCGGTLINSRWILTATHCLADPNSNPRITEDSLEIRLGEHQRYTEDETLITKDFNVDLIITHPDYYNPPWSNDIALVRLAEEADLSVYTPPCLPTTDQDFTGQLATVAGWGKTEDGYSSNILQELEGLEVLSDDQCMDVWGSSDISPDMVCAWIWEEGKSSCSGDSGGPLIVGQADNTFTLMGVVSFGIETCVGAPVVYAEVSKFIPWIQSTIQSNQ